MTKTYLLLSEQLTDVVDRVTLDVPLLLRMLEYSREDAKKDVDLHFVTDNMIKLCKEKPVLTMSDYESIVSK